MSLLKDMRYKTLSVIRRVLSLTDAQNWPDYQSSDAGESVSDARLLGLSTAWACVNLMVGTVGSLPLYVYSPDEDGNDQIDRDHWAHRLLHDSPNEEQTSLDFWEFMQACLELRGNAYARKVMVGTRLVSLLPLPADTMDVARVDGKLRYRYTDEDGKRHDLPASEVFHIRGFGGAPKGGLSTISFGRHSFGLAIAVDKAASSTYKNGTRTWGALKFPKFLKDDQRKATKQLLQEEHAGSANTGKPLILEGGVDWVQMSFSAQDAQILQSRSFSVEDVCRWFGIPPVLVGHTEKVSSWGSGIQEIIQGFVKFTLRRRLKRIEQSISKQILTAADRSRGVKVKFSIEALLRADAKTRAEFYRVMTQAGVMTINECRKLENLPPVPGGDIPRLQQQNVPLSAFLETDPVLAVGEATDAVS